ncbi:MAG: hypothetical protein D4S01_05560 [Dehalococcoidia bacterium]|nr:MAG: hypothetical protein D4S01_05560 [Dehalococcoidia bacterium]
MNKTELFPDNRFVALDQFLNLLGFNRFEWDSLFKILSRANCGFLQFNIGDVVIEVNIGSGESIGEGEDDWIRITFRRIKDSVEKSAIYSFEINELQKLSKRTKLRKSLLK